MFKFLVITMFVFQVRVFMILISSSIQVMLHSLDNRSTRHNSSSSGDDADKYESSNATTTGRKIANDDFGLSQTIDWNGSQCKFKMNKRMKKEKKLSSRKDLN